MMTADDKEGPLKKMTREMTEKSPTEAVRDDLGGDAEPSDESKQELRTRVESEKDSH